MGKDQRSGAGKGDNRLLRNVYTLFSLLNNTCKRKAATYTVEAYNSLCALLKHINLIVNNLVSLASHNVICERV